MTKDLKSLVQEIQKLASPPPAPPPGYTPVSVPKMPSPGGAPAGAVRRGYPDIQKMQEAIIALSREVTSQLNPQNLGAPDPRKKQEAGGRDSFADFLTKHFMRNSDVPAVEFTPNPNKKKKMEEKDPRIASKLSWVMDTMSRIGHSSTEFAADGIWGPRTAAALDNVFAMTSGLFALADAFGVHTTAYTAENLKDLESGVKDSNELPLTSKLEYAPKITKHINAIRKMYEELKTKVLQNPQYQTYIENDTPYLQHNKPDAGFTPTPEQLAVMKKAYPNGFDVYLNTTDQGTRVSAKLDVDNLATPEAFKEWMRSRGVAKDAGEVLKQVADQVGGA